LTAAFGGLLLAVVAAIAVVDFARMVIPDGLNMALGGLGLAWQAASLAAVPAAGVAAAAGVYIALRMLAAGFRRWRGVAGLGGGDIKMAAAAATWISPWNLPLLFILACLAALGVVAAQALAGHPVGRTTRVPFGPFIGLGLVLTWGLETSGLPTLAPGGG
jgi:prepilin signal peptidase PulO-like enzyme (type II secretory pathway)